MSCDKFKVGDRVKRIRYGWEKMEVGDIGVIAEINYNGSLIMRGDMDRFKYDDGCFVKIGESTMSKYEELKNKIEGLSNGWDKEADDILNELELNTNNEYMKFAISCHTREGVSYQTIQIIGMGSGEIQETFNYTNQCSKMQAFKKALTWLLDNSKISKDLAGQEVKAEIEGKVYKVKVLREEI